MGKQLGRLLAERSVVRKDFFRRGKRPKCSRDHGWKPGPQGKCVRLSASEDPEKGYGTGELILSTDKAYINNVDKGYISGLSHDGRTKREVISLLKAEARITKIHDPGDLNGDGWDKWEDEMGKLYSFDEQRRKGQNPKNKYGTSTFLTQAESSWIDLIGGPDSVKLPKDKSIEYLRDVFISQPRYSSSPTEDLSKANKRYFGG